MLSKVDFNNIMEIIESSMDDYLYVLDLQEDTYRISPTAFTDVLIKAADSFTACALWSASWFT